MVLSLSVQCLSILKCKETNLWPEINKDVIENAKINMVVQINGKTRDILNLKKDLDEKSIDKLIKSESRAKKFMSDKKIIKTIFIKNKIINYIIEKNEKS